MSTFMLITGVPGAGKTCFGVAEHLLKEVGRQLELDEEACEVLGVPEGTIVETRIVVAGVRDLTIPHEQLPHKLTGQKVSLGEIEKWNALELDEKGKPIDDQPVHQRLPNQPPREGIPCLVQNWWLWCRPGDLIFVDEAQFQMPRGILGRTPPYFIMAMDIHRHYGVRFVLVTQHPNKIDPLLRGLVNQHQHVRSVLGSPLCMVYTWDHASNPERYNTASKRTWLRRPSYYKLYKSAVTHIKAPAAGRRAVMLIPFLLLFVLWRGYAFASGKGWVGDPPPPAASAASAPAGSASAARPGATSGVITQQGKPLVIAGCMAVRDSCRCIDDGGQVVKLAPVICKASSSGFSGEVDLSLVKWAPQKGVRYEDPERQAVQHQAPQQHVASAVPGQQPPAKSLLPF